MSGQHALYAPSSFGETAHCSGSVLAKQAVPDQETQATREGEASHWVVGECLTEWKKIDAPIALTCDWIGKAAPNGVIIDQEMADGADVMVTEVLAICNKYGGLRCLLVEHRVQMTAIHPTNCWGTLDVAIDLRHLGKLFLFDYKYGHAQVEAKLNYQLIGYSQGLKELWGINGIDDQNIDVHMRIVQPRCYRQSGPVSKWDVKWCDLRGEVNLLAAQVHEAETNPQMCAGEHCRYCPAIIKCAAARQGGYQLIDYVKVPYEIEQYSDSDLATERMILESGYALLKSRLEAVNDELEYRVSNGATETGFIMQSGQGNLKYTVLPAQAAAFAMQLGVDISKDAVLTPTQTIAKTPVDKRPLIKEALKAITKRDATGLKLVPASESRTARAFQRSK